VGLLGSNCALYTFEIALFETGCVDIGTVGMFSGRLVLNVRLVSGGLNITIPGYVLF